MCQWQTLTCMAVWPCAVCHHDVVCAASSTHAEVYHCPCACMHTHMRRVALTLTKRVCSCAHMLSYDTHDCSACTRLPMQDTSLEAVPGSILEYVKDEAGTLVSRSTLLALERRLASKCLLYALLADKRLAPSKSRAFTVLACDV